MSADRRLGDGHGKVHAVAVEARGCERHSNCAETQAL